MKVVLIDNINLNDVLKHVDFYKNNKHRVEFKGYQVNIASLRLNVFKSKGVKCIECGVEGTHFKLDGFSKADINPHFGLYTDDGTLMTKDHIIPKSKGGSDHINNLQPMCTNCNRKKSNIVTSRDKRNGKLRKGYKNIVLDSKENTTKNEEFQKLHIKYPKIRESIDELKLRGKETQSDPYENRNDETVRYVIKFLKEYIKLTDGKFTLNNRLLSKVPNRVIKEYL